MLSILGGLLLLGAAASATDAPVEPPSLVRFQLKGANGAPISAVKAETRTEWEWKEWPAQFRKPNDPEYLPVLRTWVLLPKGIHFNPSPPLKAADDPFEFPGDSFFMTGTTLNQHGTAQIQAKAERIVDISWESRALPQPPQFTVHKSCEEMDLVLESRDFQSTASAAVEFIGIYCEPESEQLNVYFLHSPHLQVAHVGKPSDSSRNWVKYQFKTPEKGWGSVPSLGTFPVVDERGGRRGEISLVFKKGGKPRKKIGGFIGLSFSYVTYQETNLGIDASQITTTFKAGIAYTFRPAPISVGLSSYVNLIPLTSSPDSVDAARFWGVNARLTYQLPIRAHSVQFYTSLGMYLWGMSVPGDAYGLSSLVGMQIFLEMKFIQGREQLASVYLKYAPISHTETGFIGFKNTELAAGGSFRVTKSGASFPLAATLDFSHLSIKEAAGISYPISSTSISLGAITFF